MKPPIDYLQEARKIGRAAGLFFTGTGTRYRVFRAVDGRRIFIGSRGTPAALCSFIKRCAVAK